MNDRQPIGARGVRRRDAVGAQLLARRLAHPVGGPRGRQLGHHAARDALAPEDGQDVGDAEVLVSPYTNPAWTPLFRRAAAVVVDTGSTASHAAIVAREYGIPAVMGTGTGTSAIADGETITVDGTRGRVTREGER